MISTTDVEAILTIITPLAIAILGFRNEKFRKESKKVKELERVIQKNETEKLDNQFTNINTNLDKLQSECNTMQSELNEIKTSNASQDTSIQYISSVNKANAKCTNELAQLVMTLAEGMRDEHLDGNITAAVKQYRSFESDILNSFL